MTKEEAIQHLDNLRKAVLTVKTNQGASTLTGHDHDLLRQAIETLKSKKP